MKEALVEESSSGEGATSERQRATLATNDFIQAQGDPCWFRISATARTWNSLGSERTVLRMTLDEAREEIISGIDYAADHETDFSLHDSDKNRLFGSEHYNSGRPVYEPSPWAEGNFVEKMAMLLVWANVLNRSVPAFTEAQNLLEGEDCMLGRVIRSAKNRKATGIAPGTKFSRR